MDFIYQLYLSTLVHEFSGIYVRKLSNLDNLNISKKALYVNDKKFYILETTATLSKIGFPLKYKLSDIEAVIDPFKNKKIVINNLEYK
ncbi:hypothetical protein L5F43_12815, partial [Aliarcobacter butzleri]|uniref:hypothetical protein n=1 Tax=Aliarcobacter butzleri TaxID=28197 RepID=UPI001EDBB5D6